MKTELSIPELGLLAMTRGMLGAGIGLVLANRLDEQQRRPLGWGLVVVGLLTTVPLAFRVFGGLKKEPRVSTRNHSAAARPRRQRAVRRAAAARSTG